VTEEQPSTTKGGGGAGLPPWMNALAALVVLGLLVYSVVVLGTEGVGLTTVLGGMVAGLFGLNKFIKGGE